VPVPDSRTIHPIGPFDAALRPPGSKSLTNRALLLAALAEGESELTGVLFSDDTRVMLGALEALGFSVAVDEPHRRVTITGGGGSIPADDASIFVGNSGTSTRMLAAACCLGGRGAAYTLDGAPRMRERPIGELVDPLRKLGGTIDYLGEAGYPPIRVHGGGLRGAPIDMPPTQSSQYITALLQVGPCCADGLCLRFDGPITSRPYVEMTVGLMERFGAHASIGPGYRRVSVSPGRYDAAAYDIEPDASSATYFLAAAAATAGSRCMIEGLGTGSLQGDTAFVDVLAAMGADIRTDADTVTAVGTGGLRGVDVDMNGMPDAAMTVATLAALAEGETVIRNIGNWRVKETDRMAAMVTELRKLGVDAEAAGDDLHVRPPGRDALTPAAIDTYDDHRIAMAFSVIGLCGGGPGDPPVVTINEPGCVAKTFPDFFEYLDRLATASV